MVEWTGQQQLLFLLQSSGVGVLLGLLFEMLTAVGRTTGGRWRQFLLDALFGIPAALVTFFGALAIMDGELHPLLFVGVAVGFLTEHMSVGRWVCRGLCMLLRWNSQLWRWLLDGGERILLKIPAFFRRLRDKIGKPSFVTKKSRKKCNFFQKNT
ncbi:MAG: spore cortex biosynthesis protein YabQ [Clostridia bacterium]|nr:spore cortex biosynthesis protein YabQ [Clostridia bacterium]